MTNSWGYDQTNVDFFEVVKGAEVGKFVTLQKLRTVQGPEDGFMTAKVVPATGEGRFDSREASLRRKVKASSWCGVSVSIESYSSAYSWDGKARRCSWDH